MKGTVFADPEREAGFRRDGYLVCPLLDADAVHAVRRLYDRLHPEPTGDFVATTLHHDAAFRWEVSEGIRGLVAERLHALLPFHKVVLGTFVAKRPRSSAGRVPLHQDWWVVDNRVETAVSVWVPLVDVGAVNGCLKVVPGVHDLLGDPYPMHPDIRMPYHARLRALEEELAVRLTVEAGVAVVYDQRMLHGSDDNLSDEPRVAFNCIMIPERCEPLLYVWRPEAPDRMEAFRVDERFLCAFDYPLLPREPYPAGVRPLEAFEVAHRPLDDGDLVRLRSRQATASATEHVAS